MESELNRSVILEELHMIDKKSSRAIYGHVCPLQQTWEALITMWLLKHKFFHSSDYFSLQSLLLKSNALIISMLFLILDAWENESAFTKRFQKWCRLTNPRLRGLIKAGETLIGHTRKIPRWEYYQYVVRPSLSSWSQSCRTKIGN